MTMKKVRPIDANEIHFTRILSNMGLDMELAAKCVIDSMPTLDYAPVKHGEWEEYKYAGCSHYCSNCAGVAYLGIKTPYCPHCGAKMDGGAES